VFHGNNNRCVFKVIIAMNVQLAAAILVRQQNVYCDTTVNNLRTFAYFPRCFSLYLITSCIENAEMLIIYKTNAQRV